MTCFDLHAGHLPIEHLLLPGTVLRGSTAYILQLKFASNIPILLMRKQTRELSDLIKVTWL